MTSKVSNFLLKKGRWARASSRIWFAWIAAATLLSMVASAVITVSAAPKREVTVDLGLQWRTERADAPQLFYNMTDRSMRFDSDGDPHFAYGGDHLYYSWYDGSWHEAVVDDSYGVGRFASLALDSDDNPHISYYDAIHGTLKYAYFDGDDWDIQTVDSPSLARAGETETEQEPSLLEQLGETGQMRTWQNKLLNGMPETLRSAQTTVSNQGVGQYTSIAVNSDDDPSISYYDVDNGNLNYAFWTGSRWEVVVVDFRGDVGPFTSLALDSDDNPHISYLSESNDDLKYAAFDGSDWNIETVDSTGEVGAYTSLALDSDDGPHISYYDFSNHDLKYATPGTDTWDTTKVDRDGDVGGYTSISVDSDDRIRISYYDFSDETLKYARLATTWTVTVITDSGNAGLYTSIDVDDDLDPGISYYNAGTGELRFARWNGSAWVLRSVADGSDVGLSTSLVLDKAGLPYIS